MRPAVGILMAIDQPIFGAVCDQARQAMKLQTAADTLEWDERTGMPPAAGEYRAEQVSTIRAMVHQLRTDPQYGENLQLLLSQCTGEDWHGDVGATVSGLHRDWDRDRKLPTDLVERASAATVRGQQTWDSARKADDFSMFRDTLATIVELKQEIGQRLCEETDRTPYDALLDEYEPDARAIDLQKVFAELRVPLVDLVNEIKDAPKQPDVAFLERDFDVTAQRDFSRRVSHKIGFDFSRGRLDETSHPFCTTLGPSDIRILTRFVKNWLPSGLFGTLHEAGHGMYEQGMRAEWFGLPPGSYVSLGIHESQSRLWENQVGRSRSFWSGLYADAQKTFSPNLDSVNLDEFHFAVKRDSAESDQSRSRRSDLQPSHHHPI